MPGTAAYGAIAYTGVGYTSETVIAGATLTSPTAYNVFSAYTLTSQLPLANGICTTTSYISTLASAYTETLPAAGSGRVSLDLAGQSRFISFLDFTTCSGGGVNAVNTALVQVSNLTSSTTMTFSGVALAAMSTTLAPTTNPTSRLPLRTTTLTDVLTTMTATLSGSSTLTAPPPLLSSAEVPEIIIGNSTVTPNGNPLGLPFVVGTATGSSLPTGTGYGGNFTIPFVPGAAPSLAVGTSIWGTTLLIFVMAVGWML
ncbi:MAG: hypothetical protein Q9220_006593 [cf. Caloplaca sp. 1 TL-2023]